MHSVSSEIVVAVVVQLQLLLPQRPLHLDHHRLQRRAAVVAAVAVDRSDVVDTVDDDFVVVPLVTLTSILSYQLAMVLAALPLNLVYSIQPPAVHYCHYYSGRFPAKEKKKEN